MDAAWEGIFMLLVLKIPVVYLAAVVWWAIRAEPLPEGPGSDERLAPPLDLPPGSCGWEDWKHRRVRSQRGGRPLRPGGPVRRPARARVA